MKSILDIEISCFKNYWVTENQKTVNLLAWLNSTKYKMQVDLIRSLDDKRKRDAIKAKLPCITPSAILKNRITGIPLKEKLVKHSGFVQIDIDRTKSNLDVSNWNDLKGELSKLPNIAYLGLSASGRGYWGLIPIPPDPEDHKGYFESLNEIFLTRLGIELDDKPKNIASLRGYSYDLNAYFNHEAKTFTVLKKPVTVAKIPPKTNLTSVTDGKYQWLESWILSKISQAMPGDRHNARLKYSRLAGGYIAGGFLPASVEQSIIDCYLSQYRATDPKAIQDKEIEAIRDGIKDGKNTPAMPPPIRCLFVAFTEIEDYSDKAFKIWQRDKFYLIPKSTVYEILDFGFYVSEYFLTNNITPPQYQATAWKEINHDAVSTHQIPEKKTLIQINDYYQSEFDSIQTEIAAAEKRNRDLGNKIEWGKQECERMENCFVQIAKDCKPEWFRNSWMGKCKTNKINEIKYWIF